ncbi:MAG: GntR family transcriptional regulator [Chloroflexota bacterium]|nr:GntR family transcriptional regulator [Chloroflexota bacterium]
MKLTNAEKAYHQIKDQIIKTKLSPGDVISEAQLMKSLGLGRTPIREAIKQLQAENLVTVTPRRGMYVTDIAVTDLLQIFEVRIELEALATRLATQHIRKKQLVKLRQLAEEYKEITLPDKDILFNLDADFHKLIVEAAHNKFLQKAVEHYYDLSTRIWHLAINYTKPEDVDVEAHIEILSAIEAQDAQKAEQRMRKHINDFHKTIKQYI